MLRFEKIGRSATLTIRLRAKTPFWTRELLLAGALVLLLHLAFVALFTIKKMGWETPPSWPSVPVTAERVGRSIELNPLRAPTPELAPPPRPLISHKPLEPPFPLSLDLPQKSLRGAFIRGPYPEKLPLPATLTSSTPERASLAIRSDPSGAIFWVAWLEKTSRKELNRAIEAWLRTLRLRPENAFESNLLEIHVAPS